MTTRLHRLCAVFSLAATLLPAAWAQHGGDHAAAAARPAKTGKPALAVGAAFSPAGELWLSGLDEQGRLFVQRSADEGRSWTAPRLLDIAGEKPVADGENRPKIAFGPQATVVISYTRPLAKPYTGEIRMLRSTDGGASFGPPFTVHADRQVITHRFESIAFDARGVLHTVWIDKRDLELSKTAAAQGKPTGKPYRGAAIYRNESTDGGTSFGPDLKVADHSCECCRIALSPTPEGGMAALWRHVFEPNERDHGFALLQGAASEPPAAPVRASLDRWAVDACPHHGPGLTPAEGGGYHAVWFGLRGGEAAVRYGRLDAQGRPIGAVQALPDAGAEHADVIAAGPELAIVWRSFDGATQSQRLRAWLSSDGGHSFQLRELAATGLNNDHPRLLRHGQQLYALWRTQEQIHVIALKNSP
jgi:hypothetical protein